MSANPEVMPPVEIKKEIPAPGSLWIKESESIRFLCIAHEDFRATRISIDKRTGEVMSICLQGFIHDEYKPVEAA